MKGNSKLRRLAWYLFLRAILISIIGAIGYGAYRFLSHELKTSEIQARTFFRLAREMTYWMADGPSDSIRFPGQGPYDLRLGYSLLPRWIESLKQKGYVVKAQSRMSPGLIKAIDYGVFPIYREKTQAGLTIFDRDGRELWSALYPQRVYRSFEEIPEVIVKTLLFIENRELFEEGYPKKNPAVEWDRFAKAVLDTAGNLFRGGKSPGGSTLATQLEKFRHSPEGRTDNPLEKIRQMLSASLRSYMSGEETWEARKRIVLDYLNSIPLAAIPGYGEVIGLGDGLWAWFDADFEKTNELLRALGTGIRQRKVGDVAGEFRKVLSLLLAHRRPSHYLLSHREALHELTDKYIRLLIQARVIPEELGRASMEVRPRLRDRIPELETVDFLSRKAANSVRRVLLNDLGVRSLYELDRLDLTVMSTFTRPLQDKVTNALARLKDMKSVQAAGLTGHRLLERGDPSKVFYSITLYERTPRGNLLRVQTDNFEGPFNINEGIKLDLGSTAKLRTLVHYLEIIASLHERYSKMPGYMLLKELDHKADPLTRWALEYLVGAPDKSLRAMLNAAMERRYSASSGEAFFTGGGLHTFQNFDPEDEGQVLSVREGFRRSVNLVFIRLMRDIVKYHTYRATGLTATAASHLRDPDWQAYLKKFADKEGREYISKFLRKYKGKSPDEALEILLHGASQTPKRLAAIYRFVRPQASIEELGNFLRDRLPNVSISDSMVRYLFRLYDPKRFNLSDQAFLAHVHPLELWLVRYLQKNPGAERKEIMEESAQARQEAYRWLLRPGRRKAQERRVAIMMEVEAFQRIHAAWKRLGYPFESLVPSYATAIGTSADQPSALAELVGIILNDGMKFPTQRLEWLHFAKGTPYETILTRGEGKPERLLAPEVAAVVKEALMDVVENGTARRIKGVLRGPDGSPIPVGGKTGTGDHRYEVFSTGGKLISRKVMNRTATFVFFLGDKYYGAVTAFVPGAQAANYSFTSALAVQLLRHMIPILEPELAAGLTKVKAEAGRPGESRSRQKSHEMPAKGDMQAR